jgi:transcriptional regulator with XRE-family HTH domain
MTPNAEPIHKRLRRLRERHMLSVAELSRRLNVPQATYRAWEYGRAIQGEPYMAIARALGVSLSELLSGEAPADRALLENLNQAITRLEELRYALLARN